MNQCEAKLAEERRRDRVQRMNRVEARCLILFLFGTFDP